MQPRRMPHRVSRPIGPRCGWITATFNGVDRLAIAAEHVTCNEYETRALITVHWGNQVCHRQRINLDDPDHRKRFTQKLALSCEQAGITEALSLIGNRVSPKFLVDLCDACRTPPPRSVDRGEEQAQWTADRQLAEVEIDLEKAEWRIPAERMKMREQHIVPLSRQAVEMLRELEPLTNRTTPAKADAPRYVFPGAHSRGRPMSENTVLAALRRMGYAKGR